VLSAITLDVVRDSADGEVTEALTDNYQKLWLRGRWKPNQWIRARVRGTDADALNGEAESANGQASRTQN
jgi:hypothetical protein